MLPVAVVAIALYIAMTFNMIQSYSNRRHDRDGTDSSEVKVTSNITTDYGFGYVGLLPKDFFEKPPFTNGSENPVFPLGKRWQKKEVASDASENELVNLKFPPGQRLWLLFPLPFFSSTNNEGITLKWTLNFRIFYYKKFPLNLLFLTLCPLSLAVARTTRCSDASDVLQNLSSLTAREAWRQTGRKAFIVLGAFLFFALIVVAIKEVGDYVSDSIFEFIPRLIRRQISVELWAIIIISIGSYFSFALKACFLVPMSLYNACLILENRSIIGIFRRSYALVRGTRWRFLGIYLLTGWIVSIVVSILTGAALLVFSLFIPDLAQIREALSPLMFLTLFIGGNIEVVLPELLSFPDTVAIFTVEALIATFIIPIWAILTTHLYLERADRQQAPTLGRRY